MNKEIKRVIEKREKIMTKCWALGAGIILVIILIFSFIDGVFK